MAGTSTKSRVVTGRVPLDLAAWMEAQADSTSDLVVRALQALRQASMPKPKSAEPIDSKRLHVAGPRLSSAVPANIAGVVAWCGLKQKGKPK